MESPAEILEAKGRVWFRNALVDSHLIEIEGQLGLNGAEPGMRLRVGQLPSEFMDASTRIAEAMLPKARPVRVVAFDKGEQSNWALPWHRDLVIAVADRADLEGFSNWTMRSGIWHVRPPEELLKRMFFLRVLLDDTGEKSGDLQIAIGSHQGPACLTAHDFNPGGEADIEATCGNRGDVLAVKALVLHKSSAAKTGRRRALRIDFSADELPGPLKWAN